MRYGSSLQNAFDRSHSPILPPGIKLLLLANGGIFVLQMAFGAFLSSVFGLRPVDVVTRGFVWQLGTYMFLHGGLFHILFNMFALWMFGRSLEDVWGTRAFLKYYFVTGIGAGIITTVTPFNFHNVVIGASGAVLALLFAYARTWPNNPIYVYFLFPIPAKYFVGFLILVDLLALGRPHAGDVAHITHVGGVLVGWFYLRVREGRWLSFSDWWRRRRQARVRTRLMRKREEDQHFMVEVDRILDRINEVGCDGLTEREKETLNRASARLSERE
jgi:membrane associated rhomboid family serine protease